MKKTEAFSLLTVEDRTVYQQYREDVQSSDMSFTQLYAWQEVFHHRLRIVEGYLCTVYQRIDGGVSCYAPLGDYDREAYQRMLLKLKELLDAEQIPFCFDFVPGNWLERFSQLPGYLMSAENNDDFSDYLYEAEDFLCLAGRRNEHKRYLIHHFTQHYDFIYQSLTKAHAGDVMRIAEAWCEGRDCRSCYWGCEKRAVERVMEAWERLTCRGAVIYVGGMPKAFMIGEQISREMVVSHFQKADKTVKGLYAYISREFYIREFPGVRYINLQEDMGILALRQAKREGRPCGMARKYAVRLEKRKR